MSRDFERARAGRIIKVAEKFDDDGPAQTNSDRSCTQRLITARGYAICALSVTDRCNFRCFTACRTEPPAAPKSEMLTYEEIACAVEILVSLGIEKVRLTGGEPMLRRDIETLVQKLSRIEGLQNLALTTNGFNLAERPRASSRGDRTRHRQPRQPEGRPVQRDDGRGRARTP